MTLCIWQQNHLYPIEPHIYYIKDDYDTEKKVDTESQLSNFNFGNANAKQFWHYQAMLKLSNTIARQCKCKMLSNESDEQCKY